MILTHAGGAFGGSGTYAYAGEFTSAQNNGSQLPPGSSLFSGDEGSATLVVAPGINAAVSGSTLTPNGFYGENFTLLNTWNTDATTTTTTYLAGGVCSANAGPAQTYSYLFNNSLQCASQALAIWNTADLSVFNNVYTASLQDTIYAGSQGAGSNGYVPSRQYWFRGKVTGTVDYIFGDAAAVFDYSSIYTVPHGTSNTGTETIEAQNKARQTGSTGDYLSGYVMNSNVFTSYTTGMTGLEFGRPYGPYSTWIMLNSYVDQVAPAGYIEFSGDTNLPTSTYDEFNDLLYTDPATNSPDLNGVIYTGLGGNTGSGVTGPREVTSQSPGTPMNANAAKTSMTQVQAQAYFPTNFLSTAVPSAVSSTSSWIPTDAIAAGSNAFVPSGSTTTVAPSSSVTILMRPQTPGLGAIQNGSYTIPTGTYVLTDTYNGASTTLASGSLDASGAAYYTTKTLAPGQHALTWTYSGDSNFAGSTTGSGYNLIVSGVPTTTKESIPSSPVAYGQAATVTVQVSSATGTPNGNVTLTVDGGASSQTATLAAGSASFMLPVLSPGTHSLVASYAGVTAFAPSNSAPLSIMVNPAALSLTVNSASVAYGGTGTTLSATIAYTGALAPTGAVSFTVNGSSTGVGATTCFGSTSPITCSASFAPGTLTPGTYTIKATAAADTNYGASSATSTLTVTQLASTAVVAASSVPYGAASTSLSAMFAYSGSAVPTGAVSFSVNGSASGVSAISCSGTSSPLTCTARYAAPALAGGSYPVSATLAADSSYAAVTGSGTLTVTRIAPSLSTTSVAAPYGTSSTTLSANLAYTGLAAPTGGVTFAVNGSASGVGAVTCTGTASPLTCKAAYTLGALSAASYTLVASEAADTNYTAASDSGTFLVTSAPDFLFTNSGATYQSVAPGGTVSYSFALSAPYTSYPGPIGFAVTGLPPGATYTVSPTSITATGGAQTVTLTVATAAQFARNTPGGMGTDLRRAAEGLAFAAFLLPLCLRRRLSLRLLRVLLACGGLGVLAALSGCSSGNGFLTRSPANYTVFITATSGTVQHTASVTLNLQ